MMGKASQRKKAPKPGTSADIHARIAAEAKALQNLDRPVFQDAEKTPALRALLDSAVSAMNAQIPASFEHEEKTYYLRVSIGVARVMVFETATAPLPMALAMTGSFEEFGHLPYH